MIPQNWNLIGYNERQQAMMLSHLLTRIGGVLLACALIGAAFAQPATAEQRGTFPVAPDFGTLHFQAAIGSGKFIDGQGRLEINIRGTLLISQLKGSRTISGKFIREYSKRGRELFRGQGKIIVSGSWRGMQFFGQNISGVWYGNGVMRISGEYDKNGKTGTLWYDDPKRTKSWPATGSFDQFLPSRDQNDRIVKPKRRG
jgi:hypothetical protein